MYQSLKSHWRKRLTGQMVNVILNCDLDLAKELSEIEKEIFSTSWDPSWIRDSINNKKAIYWVKKEENKIIGYIGVQFSGDDVEILGLGILEDYRGRGHGSALMDAMLDYFHSTECNKIFLEVRDSNNVAKGLYSKFNFSRTGTRLNYYKNENAALFEMSINGK